MTGIVLTAARPRFAHGRATVTAVGPSRRGSLRDLQRFRRFLSASGTARGDAEKALKVVGELALVGEARVRSYLRQGQFRPRLQEVPGPLGAAQDNVLGRQPGGPLKLLVGAEAGDRCHLPHPPPAAFTKHHDKFRVVGAARQQRCARRSHRRHIARGVSDRSTLHSKQLVRSGQRMPVPSKELGLGGERGRRLPSEDQRMTPIPRMPAAPSILQQSMAPIARRCCPGRAQPPHTSGRSGAASRASRILHDNRGSRR